MTTKKAIPQFESLEEESEFWDSHSATEFEVKEVTVEEILEELKQRAERAPAERHPAKNSASGASPCRWTRNCSPASKT
ncbi:MAG: CopG family antitoxin [Armatimonadota bacterium]|nr:CopG family antitoxin [Armatimonadota bacterium]